MTWRDAMAVVQGQHGILALRLTATGGLLDRAPFGVELLLRLAGADSSPLGLQGVLFVRVVGWRLQGGLVNADADVHRLQGAYNWVRRFGPRGDYSAFDACIADCLVRATGSDTGVAKS